jgi:hypothetical protein
MDSRFYLCSIGLFLYTALVSKENLKETFELGDEKKSSTVIICSQ